VRVLVLGFVPPPVQSWAPVVPLAAPQAHGFSAIKIDYFSPSSLETFHDCPRKWAYRKIDRAPEKPKPSALKGVRTHGQHERWLRDAIPYDMTKEEGEIAFRSMHALPPPRSGAVEHTIRFSMEGLEFGGIVDWCGRDWLGGPNPVVLDHKTTGDLGWAKLTIEALLNHPQAPAYAHWAGEKTGAPLVDLRWNYTTTKRPFKFEPSWHTVQTARATEAFRVYLPVAREMARVVSACNGERSAGRAFSAKDVDANQAACHMYGGCDYRAICPDGYAQAITLTQEQYQMDQNLSPFAGDLSARLAAAAGQAPAPAQTQAAAQAPSVASQFQIGQVMADNQGQNWQFTGNPAQPWVPAQAAPVVQAPPAPVFQPPPSPAAPPIQYTPPAPQQAPAGAPPLSHLPPSQVFGPMNPPAAPAPAFGPVNPPESVLPPAPPPVEEPAQPKATRGKAKGSEVDPVFLAALSGACARPGAQVAEVVAFARAVAEAAKS
jgi:hypothetical protein